MEDKVVNLMVQADNLLDKISVNGNDVFALSDARKLLKAAYDELVRKPEEKGKDG